MKVKDVMAHGVNCAGPWRRDPTKSPRFQTAPFIGSRRSGFCAVIALRL